MDNPLTLQESKDQVAKAKGFNSWAHFYTSKDLRKRSSRKDIEFESDQAAKLYARSKWDEACNAMESGATISYGGNNYEGEKEAFIRFNKPEFKP